MAVMLGSASTVGLGSSATVGLCSESELLTAARDGSDRAYEELYSRYHARIRAFIVSRVHDHGRADDLAQEVFMSALRRLRNSEQEIAFKPWIYEIAKNACIDEFRRGQRTREVSLDADEELTSGARALPAVAPTPPAAVESKQRLSDLQGAFGGLSESHHRLLVMREFEGLSYDEIGRRTGMSRQMVESALFRARRKLTEEYEELASGRRCQQVQFAVADGRAQSARALGVRERRQLARHLAHCQPCRMCAHQAGVDETLLRPRSIAAKIAALLPIPLWRWPWRGSNARHAIVRAGSHPALAQGAALGDVPGPVSGLSGAAIAAAVIALGGAGGAVLSGLSDHGGGKPAVRTPAAHSAAAHHAAGASAHGLLRTPAHATRSRSHHKPLRRLRSGPGGSSTGATNRASARPGASAAGAGGSLSTVNAASTGSAAAVGKAASGAGSTVHNVLSNVTNSGGALGSSLKRATSTAAGVASGVGSTVSSTVGSTVNSVGKTVNSVGSTVNSVGSKVNSVGSTVSSVGSTVSSVGSKVSSVGSTVGSVGNAVKSTGGSSGSTAGVTNTVGSAANSAGSAVGSVGNAVSSVGSAVSSVGNALSSVGNAVNSHGSQQSSSGATLPPAAGPASSSAAGSVNQAASALL